jgi:acetyl-CoA C-acetyltransferase
MEPPGKLIGSLGGQTYLSNGPSARQMRRLAVGIVGVGAAGFKPELHDVSTRELMFEAAALAYRDAGIDPRSEVDSFITTSEDLWEGWSITDEMVPDQIGGAGRPVCTIPGDGVTGLGNAVMQIESGVADVVALEAHSKASDILDKEAVERLAQEPSLVRPLGMGSDALAALEMGAFLGASGFGLEDCDVVIENSRAKGVANPVASFGSKRRRGVSPSSEVISSPLRRADKAPYADAAVVVVLASKAWAKKNRREAVSVDGVAWSSSLPWYDGGEVAFAGYARSSFERAAEQAGLGGGFRSLDLVEIDDTYSFKLLQHLTSLARDKVEVSKVLRGGGPALNPSGGALAVGNLAEASALHRLYEAAVQLRGEAGARQVRGAKSALVQSWRGVPTSTGGVAILSVGA